MALRNFILAIQRGDCHEAESAIAVTDEAYQEYADRLVWQWAHESGLASVVREARSGDDVKSTSFLLEHGVQTPLLLSLILSGLEAAEERIRDGWAVLTFADARVPRILMSLIDGEWLLIVHPPGQLSELPQQVRLLKPLVMALNEYRTPDEPEDALRHLTEYLRPLRKRLEKAAPLIGDSFGGSVADSCVPRVE